MEIGMNGKYQLLNKISKEYQMYSADTRHRDLFLTSMNSHQIFLLNKINKPDGANQQQSLVLLTL